MLRLCAIVAMGSGNCCYRFVKLLIWRFEIDDMYACECCYGFGEFLPWNRENVASAGSALGTLPRAHRRHKL